jgi:hypothetical protein
LHVQLLDDGRRLVPQRPTRCSYRMPSNKAAKSLSATNLAIHHHLNCDLYLHYVYHGTADESDAAAVSVEADDADASTPHAPSALLKAQFERGLDWERRLFQWLDDADELLTIVSPRTDGKALLATLECDARTHFFVAGLAFTPPNAAFAQTYDRAGAEPVVFGTAKPDLLEIRRRADGVIVWRVVDAKASKGMKARRRRRRCRPCA